MLNLAVLILFVGSWLIRSAVPAEPSSLALGLSFLGVAGALVGGWLGGELVERLGVGVSTGANLNAPSSLSKAEAPQIPLQSKSARHA